MLVARTDHDAPKHRGLTYFLMDMEQDGVDVRPLVQITGEAEFNELFIEEARIPDDEHRRGRGQRLAGRDHDADARARRPGVRAPGQVHIILRELQELIREAGAGRRPAHPPALRAAATSSRRCCG